MFSPTVMLLQGHFPQNNLFHLNNKDASSIPLNVRNISKKNFGKRLIIWVKFQIQRRNY